jgi:hypothetical protein
MTRTLVLDEDGAIVLHATKADRLVAQSAPIPPLVLVFDTPAPDFNDPYIGGLGIEWRSRGHYETEAGAIETALSNTLPGALYDQLCARMLARKASHFNVAFGMPDPPAEYNRRWREILSRYHAALNDLSRQLTELELDICGTTERADDQSIAEHIKEHALGALPAADANEGDAIEFVIKLHSYVSKLAMQALSGASVAFTKHDRVSEAMARAALEYGFTLQTYDESCWLEWRPDAQLFTGRIILHITKALYNTLKAEGHPVDED